MRTAFRARRFDGMKKNILKIDSLARFCAEQHIEFDPCAWDDRCHDDMVRAAARYLARTSWYGHDEALERIAGPADSNSILLLGHGDASPGIDLLALSVRIRCQIAMLRGRHPRRPPDVAPRLSLAVE